MKVHLKPSEIVRPHPKGKNGFGLPAAVLSQLLHCPKLERPSEMSTIGEGISNTSSYHTSSQIDTHDLFLPPEDMAYLTSQPTPVNKKLKSKYLP